MNFRNVVIGIVGLAGAALVAFGVILIFQGNLDLMPFAAGAALIILFLLLFWKRERLGYWSSMAQGRAHIEQYMFRDRKTYDEKLKEPDRKLGKRMEQMAMALLYGSILIWSLLMPIVGFEIAVILGVSAGGSAFAVYALKWVLGYKEQLRNASARHLILSWYDFDGNSGELFLARVKFSRRLFVAWDSVKRAVTEVEKKVKLMLKARVESSELALDAVDAGVAETLRVLKQESEKYDTEQIESLKATDAMKKYFEVGVDVDPDNPDQKFEPNIVAVYPDGDVKLRSVLVFPADPAIAMDPNAKEKLRFNFKRFEAFANYLRGIRIGTLAEVLLDGTTVDGIEIDLPEVGKVKLDALDTEVDIFVITECDWTDQRRLKGLRIPKPPPLVDWFIRITKALLNSLRVGKKLEDKELELQVIRESRERYRRKWQAKDTEEKMDEPLVLSPPRPSDVPPEIPKPKNLKRRQAIAVALIGMALGALAMWFLLPVFGWRLIPPLSGG